MIAGCSGNGDGTDNNAEQTPTSEQETTPEQSATPEQTNTPENNSIFDSYGIDGTELSVTLAEDSLSQVAQIRLETPSGEQTTEVSETITEYSLDILRDRAGTWFIDALDTNEEPIETVELETTFDVSVDDIGTLAQLGVTGESPAFEEVNFQLTITNTGDVPVEPAQIQIAVPDFDFRVDTIGTSGSIDVYEEGTYGGVVDRDGEVVIPAGSDNTYRYKSGNAESNLLLFNEDRANEIAGQSFQGEFVITYQAQREDTVVPITIEMGDEVVTDSDFSRHAYLQGTVITQR